MGENLQEQFAKSKFELEFKFRFSFIPKHLSGCPNNFQLNKILLLWAKPYRSTLLDSSSSSSRHRPKNRVSQQHFKA